MIDTRQQAIDVPAAQLKDILARFFLCADDAVEQRDVKIQRCIGLQISHLISDHAISDRMRTVEAVTGKLHDEPIDLLCQRLCVSFPDGALDEHLLILCELILFLLGDGLAHAVRLSQAEAAHHLNDLHDLLLIDHDAIRVLQDRFQAGVRIMHQRRVFPAAQIFRDILHRAGAKQRDGGRDVFKGARLDLADQVFHPL